MKTGSIPAQTTETNGKEEALTGKTGDPGTERAKSHLLKPHERIDDLERNGYCIIQDPGRFCFGMDAVLLSGFARMPKGGSLLDLGTGTGIIPILMEAKNEGKRYVGLELQHDSADMAGRSVRLNGLEEKIEIVEGDIRQAESLFPLSSFDVITSNPPYMIESHGLQNPDSPMAIARHEICCTLEDVVAAAAKLLKPGGHFYMVHRPFRLVEILGTLSQHRLEPKTMRLVHPFADRAPTMVLLESVRGGRPRLSVERPLVIYEEQGRYTKEILDIYGY